MNNKNKHQRAAEATVEELSVQFKPYLLLNQARLTCLLIMVLAVIAQRTVNLVWLSQHPIGKASAESVYRRFQRFLASGLLKPERVGSLILALAPQPRKGWVLAMDRTNWKFGRTHINILVVSVVLGGVGLPICWKTLPKKTKRGNSNQKHRIALMNRVLSILPRSAIHALTMDREFVGDSWLRWLILKEVPYVVRLKKNAIVAGKHTDWWCKNNRWKRLVAIPCEVFGEPHYFAAKRICKGRDPYLAVISNVFQGSESLEIYNLRWGIENLFSHLKRRGYDFEATHLTKGRRIDALMGVLAIAFALSYQWGRKLEAEAGVKRKTHGHRAKSVFRQGFEHLQQMIGRPVNLAERLFDFTFHVVVSPLTEKIVV